MTVLWCIDFDMDTGDSIRSSYLCSYLLNPSISIVLKKLFSVSNVNPRGNSHSPLTRDYTYIQNHTALGQQVGSAGKALVLKPEFDPQNCVDHLHASSVSALLQLDGRWRQRKPPESSWASKPGGGSTGKTTKTLHQQGYPTPESYLLTSTCAHTYLQNTEAEAKQGRHKF